MRPALPVRAKIRFLSMPRCSSGTYLPVYQPSITHFFICASYPYLFSREESSIKAYGAGEMPRPLGRSIKAIRFYGIHPGSAGCRQNVQHTVCTLTAPYRTVHGTVSHCSRQCSSTRAVHGQQKHDSLSAEVRQCAVISAEACRHQFNSVFSSV